MKQPHPALIVDQDLLNTASGEFSLLKYGPAFALAGSAHMQRFWSDSQPPYDEAKG